MLRLSSPVRGSSSREWFEKLRCSWGFPAACGVFQGTQEELSFATGSQPTSASQTISKGAAKDSPPRAVLSDW